MTLADVPWRLRRAFTAPTAKQKEAYGRFAHVLAAAAVIGAVTIVFGEGGMNSQIVWRIVGLAISAVICFVGGVLVLEGE